MEMIDFIYDGIRLSSLGFTIFTLSPDGETFSLGCDLDMGHTQAIQQDHYYAIGPKYTEPFTMEFDVCRDPCMDLAEFEITDLDIRKVMQWLNRKSFHEFRAVYRNNEFDKCFLKASFNCELIRFGTTVIGFHCTMTTDAPYAWGDTETFEGEISADESLTIRSTSDEYSVSYFDAYITVHQDGNLVITNDFDTEDNLGEEQYYTVAINNVKSGNTYHFYEKLKQIECVEGSHAGLPDDFNYNFPRIKRTSTEDKNIYHSNLPVSVKFSYNPPRKVGVIG